MKRALFSIGFVIAGVLLYIIACEDHGPRYTNIELGKQIEGVTVEDLQDEYDESKNTVHITGTITNKTSTTFKSFQVTSHLYNTKGELVASPIHGPGKALAPGDVYYFNTSWLVDEIPEKAIVDIEDFSN